MAVEVSVEVRELIGQVGKLEGRMDGLDKRMDDMHRLLILLLTVSAGGLITAVVGLGSVDIYRHSRESGNLFLFGSICST